MKKFKWIAIIILVISISIILFQTFNQELFTKKISLIIFVYKAPAVPIYLYIVAAFLLGLGIGLFIAVYNFFVYKSDRRSDRKKIKQLEKDMAYLTMEEHTSAPELHPSQMKTSTRQIHELWEEGEAEK